MLPKGAIDGKSQTAGGETSAFAAKRTEILRRVAGVFAEEGFRETSVENLANRLRVSKPVLYYYARNKEDLLYQCFSMARSELQQMLAVASTAHPTGLGRIQHFFHKYAAILSQDVGRCYVLMDVRSLSPANRAKEMAARMQLEAAVKHMLLEGQEDGSIRSGNAALTARALIAVFNDMQRWPNAAEDSRIEDIVEACMKVFLFGISSDLVA